MIPQIKEQRRLPSGIVMDGWPAYATLDSATVSFEEMGDRTITAEVSIDGDISPTFDGWELVFRNEVFSLQNLAPQAIKDNSSRCSTVSLVFRSDVIADLKRYFFFAKTSTETGTAIADKYKVPLGLSVTDFVRAYNEVLTSYFKGKIRMDLYPGTYSTETKYMDINYSYLWNVLEDFYKTYGLHWRIDYNETTQQFIIKVGYPRDSVANGHTFEYGYDGGLLKFERQVQDDTIYNVLFGRGGEKNLPYRYFKFLDPNNTAFLPDPDAIPELKNIYFDRLRDSNFRSYIQGWKTNPRRDLGDLTYVCDNCHTVYHTSVPPESCPMCLYTYFSVGHDYGEVEAYDAQRGETDWAYKKGHEDELFDPVEYEKDDNSIALYGVRHGTLDDNDDIFPTIQGTGLDEVVDVSQITSDDEGQEGQSGIKSKLVEAAHTESYDGSTYSHVIRVPSVTFESDVFTIPNGYKGFLINDPSLGYANITYLFKTYSGGEVTTKSQSVLSDSAVRCYVVDDQGQSVSYQELLPGNSYRIRYVFSDSTAISLGSAYGILRSVSVSARIYLDIYGGDGFVVPNPTVYDNISIGAYSTAEKYLYSDDFTVDRDGALVLDAPINVNPPVGAVYQSSFEIINKNTHESVQSSNIPAGTYYAKVKVSAENSGGSTVSAVISLRPMIVYYSDPNKPWTPTFDIWVKNLWDTTQAAGESDVAYSRRVWTPILGNRAGDTAKVVFSSGFLASSEDYEFTIVSYPMPARGDDAREGAEWKITLQKSDVEYDAIGMYIPNSKSGWQAFPGDTFYFIGIDVPHMYVLLAEERLHQTKVDALREKAWSNPTYAVTLDKIRIHTSEDSDNGIRLVDDLDAGRIMRISDSRFSDGPLSIPIRTVSFVWNKTEATSQYLVPDVEIVLAEKVESSASDIASLKRKVSYIGDIYVSDTELKKSISRVQQKASALSPLTFEAGSMSSFEPGSYNGSSAKTLIVPSAVSHLTDGMYVPKIGEEISPAEEDLPAVVQLENASGDPIEPYCPNLEEWIGEKANLNGDMTQNFSVKSLRFRTNPMNGKYSGLSYNVNTNRIVLTDTYGTSIISEPLAFQSDLSAYAPLTSLSDYVTLATAQTISGAKTFSAALLASGGLRATSYIYPSADNSVFLGASSLRWAAINTKDIGANRYYLSEDNTTGDNYGSISGGGTTGEHYAALTVGEKTYMFNEAYGLFFQGGGVVLGRSDHRWSNVYSVNGNFSGALSVTGLTTASGGVRTNSLTHVSDYDLVIGNPGNSSLILIREDMQSYDTETIEDEEYPYWTIFEDGRALFKSVSINNGVASITSAGFATVNRLYLDANTYIYKDGNAWHLKSSVSGGSVNLIVDGDIACAG